MIRRRTPEQDEQSAHGLARTYGIGLTKDEVDKMIGGAVSVREAEARITMAGQAMLESSPEVRQELKRLYGVTDGQLSKYWMDTKVEAAKLPAATGRVIHKAYEVTPLRHQCQRRVD